MNRVRQWLNARWSFLLPAVLLVILLAAGGFVCQVQALHRAQAVPASPEGCGSGRVGCQLAEVGRLSTAQFAVRQWVQKQYGEGATIQFTKPQPVGDHWRIRAVVNDKIPKTFLVDNQGNVREESSSPSKASHRKENTP